MLLDREMGKLNTSFISTPIARPEGPTFWAARKTSNPAPLPRSMTVSPSLRLAMARGLPQLRPRFESCGMLASSSALYPKDLAIASPYLTLVVREAEL